MNIQIEPISNSVPVAAKILMLIRPISALLIFLSIIPLFVTIIVAAVSKKHNWKIVIIPAVVLALGIILSIISVLFS